MQNADIDVVGELSKWALPMLIALVSYFLHGILGTIKKFETDFSAFREEYAGHRAVLQEHGQRLAKIDDKIDQSDKEFKAFIMDYSAMASKFKNENH